jgi:two-component system, chemotaxis family, chemotaxis protein CheY
MRALIVDDSRVMRRILSHILKKLGFSSQEAANGAEALTALKESPPFDLLLLDWVMPEMNGFQLLQLLRTDPQFDTLPILVITSDSDLSRLKEAMSAGASEYLMKPFTEEAIREKLALLELPHKALRDE